MADTLELRLLGNPQVRLGGREVKDFISAKVQALFFYLAVTGQSHSRDHLAALFWGNSSETSAKRSLSKALSNLRQLIGSHLLIERQDVAFNFDLPHQLDVAVFEATVARARSETNLNDLKEAADLYQGDFLEGFHVKDAYSFEEWAVSQRERLRELILQTLDHLVEEMLDQADHGAGLTYARRLLELDPWREAAHRQMMMLLSKNGQRSAALAQYDACRQILAEALGVEPETETTALYNRLQAADTPPPHNLSPSSNVFIGREAELRRIIARLNDPAARLVCLVGPGGIGKTRLALQAATHFLDPAANLSGTSFADGVYFVNLAAISSGELPDGAAAHADRLINILASATAEALDISFHGPTGLAEQLLDYLQAKELLLVLDNFEHLLIASHHSLDFVIQILQKAPAVKLLVTSRERLNLQEEWVLEVGGLVYPDSNAEEQGSRGGGEQLLKDRDQLPNTNYQSFITHYQNYSAIALFVERAQHIRADFTLSTTAPQVMQLCQLVEGVPLALELAASWLKVLTCAEIVREIEHSLDFLTTSLHNVPARHRSLRVVFDYSWQMLSSQEQTAFQKLSVFQGGFQREAAEMVAQASLPLLTGLVDKSLLRLTASGRYQIHELLRQYALEKLAQTPVEQEAVFEAHARTYARFLADRERLVHGRQALATLDELAREADNLRAYWQWAISPERAIDVEKIEQGFFSLAFLYSRRGWYQESLEMFGQAAVRLRQENSEAFTPEQTLTYGYLLTSQGIFTQYLGDYQRTIGFYQESLLAYQQANIDSRSAKRAQAFAYHLLGSVAWQQGNYAEAKYFFRESLPLFKAAQDSIIETRSIVYLGIVAYSLGNYSKAEALLKEGLRHFNTSDDFWYAVETLEHLAVVSHALDKPLTDIKHALEKRLEEARRSGQAWLIAYALQGLGTALRLMGEADRQTARQMLEESITLYRERNAVMYLVPALYQLGLTTSALGDYQVAEDCFREALKTSISAQLTPMILAILVGLADLHLTQHLALQGQERLVTLLTAARHHPASSYETQVKAAKLLSDLAEKELQPTVLAAAQERAETVELETLAAEFLAGV